MKIPSLPPFIDPAFLYLSGFFALVGLAIVLGNAYLSQASGSSTNHFGSGGIVHRVFPAESEVHDAVRMGQTEEDVIYEMGQPLSRGQLDDGVTVLNYVKPMSQAPPKDQSYYCGFSVYIKSDKVMDINIIRGSDLRD